MTETRFKTYELNTKKVITPSRQGGFPFSPSQGELESFGDREEVHNVTSLLKLYYRELPEPLMTFELYDCFIAAIGTFYKNHRHQHSHSLLQLAFLTTIVLCRYHHYHHHHQHKHYQHIHQHHCHQHQR